MKKMFVLGAVGIAATLPGIHSNFVDKTDIQHVPVDKIIHKA